MLERPDDATLALMAELEGLVGTEDQITARLNLAKELGTESDVKLLEEQLRGSQVLLRNLKLKYDVQVIARDALAAEFDPDYVPPPRRGESPGMPESVLEELKRTREQRRSEQGQWRRNNEKE